MTNFFTKVLGLTYIFYISTSILYSQPRYNITPHYDVEKRSGTIHIQISGYNTDDFCYEWNGPDGFKSTATPPLKGLAFGSYYLKLTDCNQIIAAAIGTACKSGEDFTVWDGVNIEGATCSGFGTTISYSPEEVCRSDNSLTLFAPAVLPDCIEQPLYQWYDRWQPIGNEEYLENQKPGEYCVHITTKNPNRKCNCEIYLCQYIEPIDEDFDVILKAQPSQGSYLPSRPTFAKDYLLWEYQPGDINVKIEDYIPDMEYKGYLTIDTRKQKRAVIQDLNMIPGSVTLLDSLAVMTNVGYGRFHIRSRGLLIGDELCVTLEDTCDNLLKECIKVSNKIVTDPRNAESKLNFDELVDEPDLEKLLTKLKTLDPKSNVDFELDGWQVTSSSNIWWRNTKLLEIYHLHSGQYFLLSDIDIFSKK